MQAFQRGEGCLLQWKPQGFLLSSIYCTLCKYVLDNRNGEKDDCIFNTQKWEVRIKILNDSDKVPWSHGK